MTITGMSPYRGNAIRLIPAVMTKTVTQGTWADATVANIGNVFTNNYASQGNGDKFSVDFWAPGGTYTILLHIGATGTSGGIVDVAIDGSVVMTYDVYAASADYKKVYTQTGVNITPGKHTMSFTVNGKNGSSSSYAVSVAWINLVPTSFGFTGGGIASASPLILIPTEHRYPTVIQGTWADAGGVSFFFNAVTWNTSNANGDSIIYPINLDKGDYKISFCCSKGTNYGICKLSLDGTLLLTVDGYSGTTLNNQITSATFTQTTRNIGLLKMLIDGKNASSSGYYVIPQSITFERTA